MKLNDSWIKDILFSIEVAMSFNLEGAHFVLFPTILAKLFGANGGIRTWSVGFTFVGIASIISIEINNILLDRVGLPGLCIIFATLSLISLTTLIFVFQERRIQL
jgi:hypothetical protein